MLIKPGHLLPVAREGAGVSLSTRRCFLHDQRKHREVVLLNNRSLWQLKGAVCSLALALRAKVSFRRGWGAGVGGASAEHLATQ